MRVNNTSPFGESWSRIKSVYKEQCSVKKRYILFTGQPNKSEYQLTFCRSLHPFLDVEDFVGNVIKRLNVKELRLDISLP